MGEINIYPVILDSSSKKSLCFFVKLLDKVMFKYSGLFLKSFFPIFSYISFNF